MIEGLVAGVAVVLIGFGARLIWDSWWPLGGAIVLLGAWLWWRRIARLRRDGA